MALGWSPAGAKSETTLNGGTGLGPRATSVHDGSGRPQRVVGQPHHERAEEGHQEGHGRRRAEQKSATMPPEKDGDDGKDEQADGDDLTADVRHGRPVPGEDPEVTEPRPRQLTAGAPEAATDPDTYGHRPCDQADGRNDEQLGARTRGARPEDGDSGDGHQGLLPGEDSGHRQEDRRQPALAGDGEEHEKQQGQRKPVGHVQSSCADHARRQGEGKASAQRGALFTKEAGGSPRPEGDGAQVDGDHCPEDRPSPQ